MTETEIKFFNEYFDILKSFLSGSGEAGLQQGYELGRKAIDANLGLLQVIEIYQKVLVLTLESVPTPAPAVVTAAGELLMATLGAFEITHQGFKESIAKLQRLNRDLDRQTVQLVEANRELESFSDSVSHDLRAPLRSIKGFVGILLEDHFSTLNQDAQNLFNRVNTAVHKMEQLIEALLLLSKINITSLEFEPVDLTRMVKNISLELQEAAPQRIANFSIAENVRLEGDFRMLQIAMTNLLSNAWKYTSNQANTQIEFGTVSHEGKTIYFIRDNGAGFDMRYAERLFVPFQRLHTNEQFEGIGIGLSTVNRIIKRHGGRIWAEASLDQGATFYFTFS
ncbi:MAG: ATP-binding protein [Bdellovibrionia bacterium]